MFRLNGYPLGMFEKCVKKFLYSKHNDSTKLYASSVDHKNVLCIPYIGLPSLQLKKKLENIFRNDLRTDVKCVFRSHKIGMHFSLKDATPHNLLSCLVYKYTCVCDAQLSYIGKTKRHLATRIREHASRESAIRSHLDNCNTCELSYNKDCFSIMDKGNSDFDCYIKEALLIKKHNPKLNLQLYSGRSFQLQIF